MSADGSAAGASDDERGDGATEDRQPDEMPRSPLARVRADDRTRWGAMALGVVAGLALAWIHWLGLVVGGALVALPLRRARFAPLAGLAFGVVALLAFVVATPAASVGELLALRPPIYVALGGGLVLPSLGSLVRGAF